MNKYSIDGRINALEEPYVLMLRAPLAKYPDDTMLARILRGLDTIRETVDESRIVYLTAAGETQWIAVEEGDAVVLRLSLMGQVDWSGSYDAFDELWRTNCVRTDSFTSIKNTQKSMNREFRSLSSVVQNLA